MKRAAVRAAERPTPQRKHLRIIDGGQGLRHERARHEHVAIAPGEMGSPSARCESRDPEGWFCPTHQAVLRELPARGPLRRARGCRLFTKASRERAATASLSTAGLSGGGESGSEGLCCVWASRGDPVSHPERKHAGRLGFSHGVSHEGGSAVFLGPAGFGLAV